MPTNYCATFREQVDELKGSTEELTALFERYQETGAEEQKRLFEGKLREFQARYELSVTEYKRNAVAITREFFEQTDDVRFGFTDNLRITLSVLPGGGLHMRDRAHARFFPVLVETIMNERAIIALRLSTSIAEARSLRKIDSLEIIGSSALHLPSLQEVDSLVVTTGEAMSFSKLLHVRHILIRHTKVFAGAPVLETVDELDLRDSGIKSLTEVFPSLKSIRQIALSKRDAHLLPEAEEWERRGIVSGGVFIDN